MHSEQCASAFKNALWNFDEVSVLLSCQFNLCVIFFFFTLLIFGLKVLITEFSGVCRRLQHHCLSNKISIALFSLLYHSVYVIQFKGGVA